MEAAAGAGCAGVVVGTSRKRFLGSLVDGGRSKLAEIPGLVPSLRQRIVGCAFAGRCSMATELCGRVTPAIETKATDHLVACHYAERRLAA